MGEHKKTIARKAVIAAVAKGLKLKGKIKKKKLIRDHINSDSQYDHFFKGLPTNSFNGLINLDELEIIPEESTLFEENSTETETSGYANTVPTDRLALECEKYNLPIEAVSSFKWVNHNDQMKLNIAFHPKFIKEEKTNANIIEAMNSAIVKYIPKKVNQDPTNKRLCNQYTLTDYHLGMVSWANETGDEWNTTIAEDTLVSWFSKAIELSPNSEQAIFANIGDFLHFDGILPVTPMSKHVLDTDVRFGQLVRIAIRVMRRVINMLLEKYPKVHILHAEGNHDISSSIWLREMFKVFYEDEPRVTVEDNPDPYYNFVWGKTCLFYHHSHLKGMKQLDTVFASKFKKEFGNSVHVYAHMGHLHHDRIMETNLMVLEQHRTLSAKDAYSARGGYNSGRDAKVITYHKDFGEVGRQTINPQMLK